MGREAALQVVLEDYEQGGDSDDCTTAPSDAIAPFSLHFGESCAGENESADKKTPAEQGFSGVGDGRLELPTSAV